MKKLELTTDLLNKLHINDSVTRYNIDTRDEYLFKAGAHEPAAKVVTTTVTVTLVRTEEA